jgi:hypothetical protein
LVVNSGAEKRLFVCAVNSHKHHGILEVSGFRVFVARKNKAPKSIFESDQDAKIFRVSSKGEEIVASELLWNGKENTPAFETIISCSKEGCHASKPPRCIFEKPKPGSRRALEQLGVYQHGKNEGKAPQKSLIDALASLAYSGDQDALKFFNDRGSLSLDGEAGDAYFDHQASLERLKKAGCL